MVVVPAIVHLQLLRKVSEGIEQVCRIEPFIIFAVATLYFPVVTGRIGPDQLMCDTMLRQMCLEQGGPVPMGSEAVCELGAIICLDAFDGHREGFDQMFQEQSGRIGAMLLKSLYKAPAGVFIDGGVLEELLSNNGAVLEAGRGDELDVHLEALPGICHLLVGLGDVFGIGRMDSHDALLLKETVESGDGAGIATLHEFHPKDDKTGIGIAPAHIRDELDFRGRMLVRMTMRSSGAVTQRL